MIYIIELWAALGMLCLGPVLYLIHRAPELRWHD